MKSVHMWRTRGFTLIELLVTITIAGVLLTIAIPSFNSALINYRLTTISNTFLSSAQLARSEAIKRNSRVTLCQSADGVSCAASGGWQQGWIIFQDTDNNAARAAVEALIHSQIALPQGFATSTGDIFISYMATGGSELTTGAFQATTVTWCNSEGVTNATRQIVINAVGRAKVAKSTSATCVSL